MSEIAQDKTADFNP